MKRFIMLVMWVILLVGCRSQEVVMKGSDESLDTQKTDEVMKKSQDELTEEDPLVAYALEHITFKFSSDDGQDYEGRELSQNVEDLTVKAQVEQMNRYIDNGEFHTLREMILGVPDYNRYLKEIKINYIVPILMSEGNYEDALRIVQKKYDQEPEGSHRFLFDTVYLCRYMNLNKGLEYSMEVIDRVREEFPDRDLSYVWLGVSLGSYDDLVNDGYCAPCEEGSEAYEYFMYLLDEYPDEPFMDYLYYYLGMYDRLLEEFDDSVIEDRVNYAIANRCYEAIINQWGYDSGEIAIEDIEEVTDLFEHYVKNAPDIEFHYFAVRKLLTVYNVNFEATGEDAYYYELIDKIGSYGCMDNWGWRHTTVERYIGDVLKNEYCYGNQYIPMDDRIRRYLEEYVMSDGVRECILSGLAHNAFKQDQISAAYELFTEIKQNNRNYEDRRRLNIIYAIEPYIEGDTINDLFKIAEILRANYEYSLSLVYYDKIIARDVSDEILSKAYMLKASSYRELDDTDKMLETYTYVYEHLPETQYADDALAETGVHYLLYFWDKDNEKARDIFQEVIEKYPDTNAVNNAYNWIAWSYLQDKNYPEALAAYERLRDKFPMNRYGINATFNIKKIEGLMAEE